MTDQEQLTIYERIGPNGIQRWARSKDGKTIELPMVHFIDFYIDGRSPFVFFKSPPDDFWNTHAAPEKTVHLLDEENK